MGSHGHHGGFESGKPANRDLKISSRSFDEKVLRRSKRFGHRLEGSRIPAKLVDDSGLSYTAQSRYESALGITSSDYVIREAGAEGRVVTTLQGGGVYSAKKTRPACRTLSYILRKHLTHTHTSEILSAFGGTIWGVGGGGARCGAVG